jgi:hypothetical protein
VLGSCDQAQAAIEQAIKLDPLDSQLQLFELKALACMSAEAVLVNKLRTRKWESRAEQTYAEYLQAPFLWREGRQKWALDRALKMMDQYPGFAESYYLAFKWGAQMNKNVVPWAQKYLSLCASLTDKERNLIIQEPVVCTGVKEIESELAKLNSDP